ECPDRAPERGSAEGDGREDWDVRHDGLACARGEVAGVDGASDAAASLEREPARVLELRDVQLAAGAERDVDDGGQAGRVDGAGWARAAVGVARAGSDAPDAREARRGRDACQLSHGV